MDNNEARLVLENYLTAMAQDDFYHKINLPVVDARVYCKMERGDDRTTITEYTFKHLIKLAYNLTDKENP